MLALVLSLALTPEKAVFREPVAAYIRTQIVTLVNSDPARSPNANAWHITIDAPSLAKVGDDVYVTINVVNTSDSRKYLGLVDCPGSWFRFRVIETASGQSLPTFIPLCDVFNVMLAGVDPGASWSGKIELRRYVTIDKAGMYQISVDGLLESAGPTAGPSSTVPVESNVVDVTFR